MGGERGQVHAQEVQEDGVLGRGGGQRADTDADADAAASANVATELQPLPAEAQRAQFGSAGFRFGAAPNRRRRHFEQLQTDADVSNFAAESRRVTAVDNVAVDVNFGTCRGGSRLSRPETERLSLLSDGLRQAECSGQTHPDSHQRATLSLRALRLCLQDQKQPVQALQVEDSQPQSREGHRQFQR